MVRKSSVATPVWTEDEYPHYRPGRYEVRVIKAVNVWHPMLRAWKCIIKAQLLAADLGFVWGFLHGGNDKKAPKTGRHSKYFRVWTMANGAMPRKRQALSAKALEGKNFIVEIGDTVHNFKQQLHPREAVYSVIREFVECTWRPPVTSASTPQNHVSTQPSTA